MNAHIKYVFLAILSIFIGSIAQICLKFASKSICHLDSKINNIKAMTICLIGNYYTFAGCILYVFCILIWIVCLSRLDLSTAAPLTALSYIFTLSAGYFLFNEYFSAIKIAGIILIILGVFLIGKSVK